MLTVLLLAIAVLAAVVFALGVVIKGQKKKLNEFLKYEYITLTETVPSRDTGTSDDRYQYVCALKLTDDIAKSGAITRSGNELKLVVCKNKTS